MLGAESESALKDGCRGVEGDADKFKEKGQVHLCNNEQRGKRAYETCFHGVYRGAHITYFQKDEKKIKFPFIMP